MLMVIAVVNIELYTDVYFSNGLDVPYKLKKGGELLIQPIKLKDYSTYAYAIEGLKFNKNEINDISIIQMSYLQFLVDVIFMQSPSVEDQIRTLFSLCLGEDYIGFSKDKGKTCIVIGDKETNQVRAVVTAKEFDEISKIILHQNDAHYDDRYVNAEVRQMLEEYHKIKYKDSVAPSLEKRKAFVCSKIGKTYKELGEMTYREFDMIYDSAVGSEIYLATKVTESSSKYDVKSPTIHPLFEKPQDMYAEIFEDTSVLSNKGIAGAESLSAMNHD